MDGDLPGRAIPRWGFERLCQGVATARCQLVDATGRPFIAEFTNSARWEAMCRTGSCVGCIAGALSYTEYRQQLRAAGFTNIPIEASRQLADSMASAIIKATKPIRITRRQRCPRPHMGFDSRKPER